MYVYFIIIILCVQNKIFFVYLYSIGIRYVFRSEMAIGVKF